MNLNIVSIQNEQLCRLSLQSALLHCTLSFFSSFFEVMRLFTHFCFFAQMSGAECDSDMDYSEEDCAYDDYYNYNGGDDCDIEQLDPSKVDPEYFAFECLSVEDVERLLNEPVENLSNSLQVCTILLYLLRHVYTTSCYSKIVSNCTIHNLILK